MSHRNYEVHLHIIVVKDDQGVGSDVDVGHLQSTLTIVNQMWAPAGIQFRFNAGNMVVVHSTALRNDTTPGDYWANARERTSVASQHLGHLVVFVRDSPPEDYSVGANFSGGGGWIVLLGPQLDPHTLAHELGHFFHLEHTMSEFLLEKSDQNLPQQDKINKLRARFADTIRQYVAAGNPVTEGLNALDQDRPRVTDTPADVGTLIFELLNGGNPNGPIGQFNIPVTFGSGAATQTITYTLQPDRDNRMSYFFNGNSRITAGQSAIIRASIANGNCKRLVEGKSWADDVTSQLEYAPAAISWGQGRVDLFARAENGAIFNKVWEPDRWWPGEKTWASLGGDMTGPPCAVSWGPNRVDLFARGVDGHVYHKVWQPSQWWPGQADWEDLGGQITGSPVAVTWGANRIDLFVRGMDGSVYNKVWEPSRWWPSQTGWSSLGGEITGIPAAVSWGPGRLDVFARGTDGSIYNKVWEPSRWWPSQEGWSNLGGAMSGSPVAVSWGPGRLDVFANGADGRVYNKVWEPSRWWPSQTGWEDVGVPVGEFPLTGGAILAPPVALSLYPKRIDVLMRSSDGFLFNKVWEPSRWWPDQTGWNRLMPETFGGSQLLVGAQTVAAMSDGEFWVFMRAIDGEVLGKQWSRQHDWRPSQQGLWALGSP